MNQNKSGCSHLECTDGMAVSRAVPQTFTPHLIHAKMSGVVKEKAASIRALNRERITAAILDAARDQIVHSGASALSVRAITRELGMASPAIYRYFPSRDDLLTKLIIDSYDSLGAAVEAAESRVPRGPDRTLPSHLPKYAALALDNQHEYFLIYGTQSPAEGTAGHHRSRDASCHADDHRVGRGCRRQSDQRQNNPPRPRNCGGRFHRCDPPVPDLVSDAEMANGLSTFGLVRRNLIRTRWATAQRDSRDGDPTFGVFRIPDRRVDRGAGLVTTTACGRERACP